MGRLRDSLAATAHEKTDYYYHVLGRENPEQPQDDAKSIRDSLRKHTTAKTIPLPSPFNRTVPGVTEALIKKHAMASLKPVCSWLLRVNTEMLLRFTTGDCANAHTNPMRGCPDVLAIINGIFFGIELKKPGGRLSGAQYTHLSEIHSSPNSMGVIILTKTGIDDMLAGREPKAYLKEIPIY